MLEALNSRNKVKSLQSKDTDDCSQSADNILQSTARKKQSETRAKKWNGGSGRKMEEKWKRGMEYGMKSGSSLIPYTQDSNIKPVVAKILNDIKRSKLTAIQTKKSVDVKSDQEKSKHISSFKRQNLGIKHDVIMRILNRTENVTCKICSKNFKRNLKSYVKHMTETHKTSEKSLYECPICARKFSLYKYLVQHVRTHLVVKVGAMIGNEFSE